MYNVSINSAAYVGKLQKKKIGNSKFQFHNRQEYLKQSTSKSNQQLKSLVKSQVLAFHFHLAKIINSNERHVLTLPNHQSKYCWTHLYCSDAKTEKIICDTCNLNTRAKPGVIVRLQSCIREVQNISHKHCTLDVKATKHILEESVNSPNSFILMNRHLFSMWLLIAVFLIDWVIGNCHGIEVFSLKKYFA